MRHQNTIRVGDGVSFLLGGQRAEGLVVEDRGPLAKGGKHLYRILVSPPSEEPITFEMPADQIALLTAQRTLFGEMAGQVIQSWWQSPVGSLVDHLNGFQCLAKTVLDACIKVSTSVRQESFKLTKALHMADSSELSKLGPEIKTAQEVALHVGSYAQRHGFDGLHEQIENALWTSAVRERERVLRIAQDQGWSQLERALDDPALLGQSYPFLTLLAARPQAVAR